ncbi:IclR family transcriptional regulator [Schinkia azotoformans]|uniref:IclR family protein transcriptional regulator n=1 Tax=Schinkia azotoformans LMG 9581 TaxID=1131731 RepID=K6C828_SCHAZ|nr:IclR family transcriptional regulator [Schinkia azotoformans]EKN67295.1 IclR family protein transcriptional regulator [Schinkia azotoformans LMG 9581]MEC1639455.1 IclR family transcriptional regulator [Schinkia azotoformans]MEC1944291.1 IclR family transcriptional regulator [Schinkia azotoformans]
MSEPNNSILQSVQRGLQILKLFSPAKPVWGITDIATTLKLSKSTVSRITSDLVEEGYLEKTRNKYRLGFSLLALSGVITSHLEIHKESSDTLKSLVHKLGETAHIAILEDLEITYLHKIECQNPVRLFTNIGKKNPPTCTGCGKILLAYQPETALRELIDRGLPMMGPKSITDPQKLMTELQNVRKNGYSLCIDEMQEGIISIGAAIRDYTNEVVAAVSIVGPKERGIGRDRLHYIAEVIKAAEEISEKLGYIKALDEKSGSAR